MDYFKQRRAYRNFKLYEASVSNGQNNLYRELLDYANDEGKLDDMFPMKNSALLSLTGLSEAGIKKARNELIQLGLIDYVKGRKNVKAPEYRIINLYDKKSRVTSRATTSEKSSSTRTEEVAQPVPQPVAQPVAHVFTSTDYNLTDTTTTTSSPSSVPESQNNEPEEPHPIAFYQRVFNRPATAIQTPIIMDYADELGSSMVNHALMLAGESGASFNYAKGIMDNWIKDGIKTVEQAKQASADFKSKKKSGSYSGRTQVKETLPDWATNTNQKTKESAKITPEQEAIIAARLAKLEASKKEASHE
ncbi:DnaD domain protein [Lentilactobacillus senioris]|uniref:DnaD domain protein n=1 Tax=Lentilactobacillus senioris TaxID=931534 RepID=UPI003D29178A